MQYTFRCKKCNTEEERSIPMAHYTELEDQQFHSCGERMVRVIEFSGNISLCKGMYGAGEGGWNS